MRCSPQLSLRFSRLGFGVITLFNPASWPFNFFVTPLELWRSQYGWMGPREIPQAQQVVLCYRGKHTGKISGDCLVVAAFLCRRQASASQAQKGTCVPDSFMAINGLPESAALPFIERGKSARSARGCRSRLQRRCEYSRAARCRSPIWSGTGSGSEAI